MQLTLGKALFLFFTILSISSNLKNNDKYKAMATSETILVSSFDSDIVVTGQSYRSYQNDEWLITVGGNNRDIGTDSFSSSQAQLNARTNLTAFNPSISGTTRFISAVIGKNSLSNINGISISRSGSSYFNYSGVSAYLVSSDSLEDEYSLITTIGSITTSSVSYSFEKVLGNKYYALVFYNPSGVFSLGGVVVNFYSTEETRMNKVTSKEQLIFGATYGLVNESYCKMLAARDSEIDVETVSIDNDMITTSNHHEFILGIGSEIGTYTLFSAETGLFINSNEEDQIVFSSTPLLFTIDFDNGAYLKDFNNQYFHFDSGVNQFIMSAVTNVSLYINEQSIDHDLELGFFVDEVLVVGEGAKGNCEETYLFLNNIYERLSLNAQTLFINSQDEEMSLTKERMTYLSSWASQHGKLSPIRHSVNHRPYEKMYVICGITIIGLVSFSLHVILKKENE